MDEKCKAYAPSCYIEGFCLAGHARITPPLVSWQAATDRLATFPGGPLPSADTIDTGHYTMQSSRIVWCPLRAADLPDNGVAVELACKSTPSLQNHSSDRSISQDMTIFFPHYIYTYHESTENIRCANKRQERLREQRKKYAERMHKKHGKKWHKSKRGRKPEKVRGFKPKRLSNKETLVEALTKCRIQLQKSREKWTKHQEERAKILFNKYPKLEEAYLAINKLRYIFKNTNLDKVAAKERLEEWYKDVNACTLREVKSVRDTIKYYEDEILNYFIERETNASAESLNSKIKIFRADLRGVNDVSFFMFRVFTVLG